MSKITNVTTTSIKNIEIGSRYREDFGDIDELAEEIKLKGFNTALTVVQSSNNSYLLAAGERRLRAAEKAGVEEVPVIVYDNLSEYELRSIELCENLKRKNLEWWEEDRLVTEITRLQQEQHGKKIAGGTKEQKGWSGADTAKLVDKTPKTIYDAIRRTEAREKFPELFEACKTKKDASKILSVMDEHVVKQELLERAKKAKKDNSTRSLIDSYIVGDFFKCIADVPKESISLVEIDPPYAINLSGSKKSSHITTYGDTYNEVPSHIYEEFMERTLTACYKVMKPDSWLILWFAPEPWAEILYNTVHKCGFKTTRLTGKWIKSYGQSMRPEYYLANTCEDFYYCWKGRPILSKQGRGNTFQFPSVLAQHKVHPTERPIDLMKAIYSCFADAGSNILIPFLGSGNGLIAANELYMNAFGYELSKDYKDSFIVKVSTLDRKE